MSKFLTLFMAAILSIAAMAILSGQANAQGFQRDPISLPGIGKFAEFEDGVIEVRSRNRRVRRSRRRNNAAAGAIIGAIIGSAIIAQQDRRRSRRRIYRGDAHEHWCYRRYRSYRVWDNTFQPYRGRRRQCISPYY